MPRINTPALDTATGAAAEVFGQIKKAVGSVPNTYAAIGFAAPAALKAMLAADGVVAASSLNKGDQETIRLLVSAVVGCDYCVAAHSLLGKMAGLSPDALRQIRAGDLTGDTKRDALIRFVKLLTSTTGTIDQSEYTAIRAAGYTDQQLVEISLAIAAITFTNVFNRINDTTIDFPAVN
ncbi:MAG: carboxymuconolactone decarboxylase family protein [Betaproteobacteria bacterium]|nr:carboxymuconolactone decarboxylase family protein [Betaproteobacteria bacterium]